MSSSKTLDFITKAKSIHGEKYDYSKVLYLYASGNVLIICSEHGEFWQRPSSHLSGQGCPTCAEISFISRAKKVHGDLYDYSDTEYFNNSTKISIRCKKHGLFKQSPSNHLNGSGCSLCAVARRSNTQKDFLSKARKIHGDRYDYSKVIYTALNSKVLIICPEHGDFWQTPSTHFNGSGCQTCAKNSSRSIRAKFKSTEEFVQNAKKVHGGLYDYSDTEYFNNSTKISIRCKKHGLFKQLPSSHLGGSGCALCFNERISNTQEDFINKARKTHGDRYDYSKVIYTALNSKVLIICRVHGDFWQTGKTHLNGGGCKECARKKRSRKVFLSTEQFIERAKKLHEDLYDYSDVRYVNSATKVRIKCKKHGVFEQSANSHLSGHGCKECARKKSRGKSFLSTEQFIERAKKVHEDLYDYSDVKYVSSKTKVRIKCKKHGVFEQSANSHLSGHGCKECARKKVRRSAYHHTK